MPGARPKSGAYFKRASRLLVGGVNSPVRAFRSVGGTPLIASRGKGPYLWDIDGRRYIDYVLSWGPLLLGHAPSRVLRAVAKAAKLGTSFGACHPLELELAEGIQKAVPSMQKIRFVSSGTEATLSALRLARGATGRPLILKFDGCYHGHSDSLLVKAGSGAATLGIPGSRGVLPEQARATLTVPYNDIEAAEAVFARQGKRLAAVIVEPVAGNMGFIRPAPGFLEGLRRLCTRYGSVLIFDEVMTGFRVAYGGAQALWKVRPDLTCLGKVIGGGLPAAAFGGRRDLMDELAPLGSVYQAGTLSGNPLAMAAGLAMLTECSRPGFYEGLHRRLDQLLSGWRRLFEEAGIPAQVNGLGSMFGLYFSPQPVGNFSAAKNTDAALFRRFFHALFDRGVYLAPSAFEAGFISSSHSAQVIGQTLERSRSALKAIARP